MTRVFPRMFCALMTLALVLWAPDARAERRVALIIGNAAYQQTSALRNPRHDAEDMGAALKRLGFEVVEGHDLDKRSMERTIRQFGTKLSGADIAFFFFAGHGVQIGGHNYLLPVDARLSTEGDVDFESIALSLVLKQMEREAKTSLLLLDACRDNPLARNLARTMGTRSSLVSQGLAEVKTGVGTLIGFSTQPGNVALDGSGRNSPYAAALLRHVEARDLDFGSILINVRSDVVAATNGKQVPWEHTSLMGRVVFQKTPRPASEQAPAAAPANPSEYDKEMELAFWNAVKDTRTPELLQTYLNRFPAGTFAELAKVLIEQSKQPRASSPETKPGVPVLAGAAPVTAPAEATQETLEALQRSIHSELRRLGCEPGGEAGKWRPGIRDALERYNKATSSKLSSESASRETLAALASRTGRACPLTCGRNEEVVDGRCVAKTEPKKRVRESQQAREREVPEDSARRQSSSQPARKESVDNEACAQWRRCVMLAGRGFEGRCGLSPRNC